MPFESARVGDWVRYRLAIDGPGPGASRTAELRVELASLTDTRWGVRTERRFPGQKLQVEETLLPRARTWRALWEASMRERGFHVALAGARLDREELELPDPTDPSRKRRLACQKATLDYRGSCMVRGREVPVAVRSVYWIAAGVPIQGIAKSWSRVTLDPAGKAETFEVTLVLLATGRAGG